MGQQVIFFQCPDGNLYALPLDLVAIKRAAYLAKRDPHISFQDEYQFVMRDPHVGLDWFRSHHTPEDFGSSYILVRPASRPTLYENIRRSQAVIGSLKNPHPIY